MLAVTQGEAAALGVGVEVTAGPEGPEPLVRVTTVVPVQLALTSRAAAAAVPLPLDHLPEQRQEEVEGQALTHPSLGPPSATQAAVVVVRLVVARRVQLDAPPVEGAERWVPAMVPRVRPTRE